MILDEEKMELIRKGEYKFTDEEVNTIYRLAAAIVRKYFPKTNHYYDLIQEMVTNFFINSIKKYDPKKNVKFTTFACICLENFIKMEIRKSKSQKQKIDNNILKADDPTKKINNTSLNLMYYNTPSGYETPSELYEKELKNKIIYNFFKNDPLLKDYYYGGLTQKQIAEKYKLAISTVSYKIRKSLKHLIQELKTNDDFNMQ